MHGWCSSHRWRVTNHRSACTWRNVWSCSFELAVLVAVEDELLVNVYVVALLRPESTWISTRKLNQMTTVDK